jgi:hypothetical protein
MRTRSDVLLILCSIYICRAAQTGTINNNSPIRNRKQFKRPNQSSNLYQGDYPSGDYNPPQYGNNFDSNLGEDQGFETVPAPVLEDVDLVDNYSNIPSLLLVSVSATISSFIVLSFLTKMIMSFIPAWFIACVSVVMAFSVFIQSDLSAFSKALGVVFIELIRRAKVYRFASDCNRYISSAMNLKERKPYPLGDNPWKYEANPNDPKALQYNQYRTMIATVMYGAFTGWSITKPIPLVPSWMVGLGTGVTCCYLATLRDSRGDLLRFVGNTMVQILEEIRCLSQDVSLGTKFGRVSMQTSTFLKQMDTKYKIVSKATALVGTATSFFQMAVSRYAYLYLISLAYSFVNFNFMVS